MPDRLATYTRPAASRLLARILETPDLPAQVQALPPAALARLIGRIGLEDAGEIVALATTAQLSEVFDEDLWRSDAPGEDERFDGTRFLLWLEVMLEAGDAFVAEKLATLPEDFVTLALHGHVLVIALEALAAEVRGSDDGDAVEKALSDCLSEELDDHVLIARRHDGWDAILAAVLALDRDHHDLLVRILERCAAMSAEQIDDDGGLFAALTSEEMLESDVAGEREERRGERGHVAPSAAAAFLKLSRAAPGGGPMERDAITRAYFRGLSREAAAGSAQAGHAAAPRPAGADLRKLLVGAGIVDDGAPRLPAPTADATREEDQPLVLRAIRRLAEGDPALGIERSEELAYVANVLAAGCAFRGRRLRPVEAVRAAVVACSEGLARAAGGGPSPGSVLDAAVDALRSEPCDLCFRRVWKDVDPEAFLEEVLARDAESGSARVTAGSRRRLR